MALSRGKTKGEFFDVKLEWSLPNIRLSDINFSYTPSVPKYEAILIFNLSLKYKALIHFISYICSPFYEQIVSYTHSLISNSEKEYYWKNT